MKVRDFLGINAKEKSSFLFRHKLGCCFDWSISSDCKLRCWHSGSQGPGLAAALATGAEWQCGICRWEQGCVGEARGQLESSSLHDKCVPELPVLVSGPCHNLMVNLPLVDYSFWCPPL